VRKRSFMRARGECLILHRGRTLKSDGPAFVFFGAGWQRRLEPLVDFVGGWACWFGVVHEGRFENVAFGHSWS